MSRQPTIWAIIPAFNVGRTLQAVIEGVLAQSLPVLVVDDGSMDNTAAIAHRAGAHVLRATRNRGKGHALVGGFRWALAQGASHVLTLDGDQQHDPSEIPRFLALAKSADLVIGRRELDASHMPSTRLLGNRVSTFFIGLFCGSPMADTQCGFRLYSRELLSGVPLNGGRFETESELLIRAHRLGFTVRWAPIETIYVDGAQSNFDNINDTLRVIATLLSSLNYPGERR